MQARIPFHKSFLTGRELHYLGQAISAKGIAADGHFTQACSQLLEQRFGIRKILLTPSCTAALEMGAMLCDLQPGDEVIMPSFTFVSTANAVVRLGARPVFVDVRPDTLNIDESLIEEAITPRTKAIFPVHYAGVACEMDRIQVIAQKYQLLIVEDAAQGVNAFYDGKALGTIGQLGAYSFHDTKNYTCGEGGALCLNTPEFIERAEILRDKGTNRKQFYRGQVDKYTWVDVGSSYVPSELTAAFLYAQLEALDLINERRRVIFERYLELLAPLEARGVLRLPRLLENAQTNYHLFYMLLPDQPTRDQLIASYKEQNIGTTFHYIPLHSSPFGQKLGYKEGDLPVTEGISSRLLRLPLYPDLTEAEQRRVVQHVVKFMEQHTPGRDRAKSSPALAH
jgi:dTDP-4-amino-4,6-dideoxygalactose transaminase